MTSQRLQEREQQSGRRRGDEHDKSVFLPPRLAAPRLLLGNCFCAHRFRLLAYETLDKESRRRDRANMLYATVVCITTVPADARHKTSNPSPP